MRLRACSANARGFALLEAIVASAIATTIAAGSVLLVSMSIHVSHRARIRTIAAIVASRKMEELKSLAWTHMSTRSPAISMSMSDLTTDLSNDPATDDGAGLLRAPPGTLTTNIDGYVDYLDGDGHWIGRGTAVPLAAVYIRRWAIEPHPGDPDNLLIFEVIAGTRGTTYGLSDDAIHLISLEARK